MNLSTLLVLITLGSAAAAPVVKEDYYYSYKRYTDIIYTSQHDIVNIFVPSCGTIEPFLFFVEADQANGLTTYQGLHVMRSFFIEKNVTKLVLKNGKDVTCDADNIYIGATDGIYILDDKEMKAEKYGTVTKNIKNIAKVNGSDLFYILTEDNKMYRVTENGTKMTIDDTIVDAQQIVLDLAQNLYYYLSDKELWVISGGVKARFEGLPKEKFYLRLLKPPKFSLKGVPVIINNDIFNIDPSGSAQKSNTSVLVKPSAFSIESGLFLVFGHNKRIYLFNVIVELAKAIGNAIGEGIVNNFSNH